MYDLETQKALNDEAYEAEIARLVNELHYAESVLGVPLTDYEGWTVEDAEDRRDHLKAILAAKERDVVASETNVAFNVPFTQGQYQERKANRLARFFSGLFS